MSFAAPPNVPRATKSAVVGIDLGTTFSVVAHVDSRGKVQTVVNSEGDLTTPTVVLFDDDRIVVGKEAIKAATTDPDRVAQFVKREMGDPLYSREVNGQYFPPEVIQSLVLEKLKRDAEQRLGPIRDVVITVPAYFNEPRRKATQDAGQMAGLNVMDIINEPTAAALAFGVEEGFLNAKGESQKSEKILVYDLGGGTFDVSVLAIDGRSYQVLATDGNYRLGGIDWDQTIVDHIAEAFIEENLIDPRTTSRGLQKLLREAEELKRTLTARNKTTLVFEYSGAAVRRSFSRTEFEQMTAGLLDRTRFTTRKVIKDSGLQWSDLSRAILVGGSTRMPMIGKMLEQETGIYIDRCLAADEAVAHGAAIYARLLQRSRLGKKTIKLTNVNAHNLGVLGVERETRRKRNRVLIPRNTSLPATKSEVFDTFQDNQASVVVNVIEGGDSSGNDATPIGKCVVRGLPPGLPAGTPVKVTFTYASNGRLTVTAVVPGAKRQETVRIERQSGLSDSEVDMWGQKVQKLTKPLNL